MKTKITLLNMLSGLLLQFCTLVSGLIIPKIILTYFGSEVNGLVISLTQFLSYISIAEGGISGVISAYLYTPLVEKNSDKLSSVLSTADHFYKKIGLFTILYSIILASVYPFIVKTGFSYLYIFSLTLILAFNLIMQYMFSLTQRSLLNADKRCYVVNILHSVLTIINVLMAIFIVKIFPSIHFLKIVSSFLFILQPIGAYINKGLAYVFENISKYCPWMLGIVPMFYLLLVLTGTHHSLMAVSLSLIGSDPAHKGWTYILAAQLMAGAAEVGAAIYIALKTKNSKLKKNIIGALPIGILGIDEPLIWGMSVPLKRPFISAGLGGLVGGTFVACFKVGAQVPEATGIQAALVFNKPGIFVAGFAMSIVAGFLIQILVGFKDPVELTDDVLGEAKEQYIETSYALKLYQKYRVKHPKKVKAGGTK